MPDGRQPVEVLVVAKCLRPEGGRIPYGLWAGATKSLSSWEGEGMALWAARVISGRNLDEEDE
jgi:hypothetical protein